MRYKKILIAFLSAAFVGGVCVADDFVVSYCRYYNSTSISQTDILYSGIDISTAFEYSCNYLAVRVQTNNSPVSVSFIGQPSRVCVSNTVTSSIYRFTNNPRYDYYTTTVQACIKYAFEKNLSSTLFSSDTYLLSGNYLYLRNFNPREWLYRFYASIPVSDLIDLNEQIFSLRTNVQNIVSDVSAIVPVLESHASNVSNLAAQVGATSTQITNRQAQSNASLLDIRNVVNSIGSSVAGIPTLISNLSLDTMGIDDLGALWLDLKGVDWQNSATPLPDLLAQNLVSSGLASSVSDAQQKLSDPAWRNSTFVPRVKYSQKKANAIAQLEASGISPPAGKSWRDLEVPELETIFEYQYNTPLADVTEVTTNWLPNIGGKVDDIAGSVGDIRDKVENGIFEVNVMNWPDDFFGFQVTLSNAFAEAFANLSITGRVIELDEDYKRYRDLYGLNGINAPSFDTVFSNAQFLAVGSPNDVNWWRESQNLLSYIAYYGTYNERIYNEISSTNFLAELAAITNRLSVLGDVEATVRRLTDDAIESGEDIKSTLENLTYYRGVSKWCDDYLQAGDTPDRVHLFDLDDHEFYIDIGQSYGFVDLIHGISAFAITLSWICTLPYMIIWLIEWFRKFADFWATKVVGP